MRTKERNEQNKPDRTLSDMRTSEREKTLQRSKDDRDDLTDMTTNEHNKSRQKSVIHEDERAQ